MVSATAIIKSSVGLHARPSTVLVQEAARHECEIILGYNGKKANAKSILQVLALGAGRGVEVTVYADGPGEEQALNKIVKLIESIDA